MGKVNHLLLFLLVYIGAYAANANHIVGGGIELVHVSGSSYKLSLIQYRDAIQQENTVIEPYITVRVFRKRDNHIVKDVVLYFSEERALEYTTPECVEDFLKTIQVTYSAYVTLNSSDYNDPQGYYVAWERCCRNNNIDNINLVAPNTVGQTYYLAFPPVEKDGKAFRNSSPASFSPPNDYACVGMPYSANFGAVDHDGDQLVYRLATPLDSSTDEALPEVSAAPYPPVPWKSGFDENIMVPGTPSLQIDQYGMLTVTPTQLGLFVFSVVCEEYREGKKIGETRVDFQLLVVDCPQQGEAPVLKVDAGGKGNFDPATGYVEIDGALPESERCLDFYMVDKENIGIATIEILPVNFSLDDGVASFDRSTFSIKGDTLSGKICFASCAEGTVPYILDLVAKDNACPAPLQDKVRLHVNIKPPKNEAPHFIDSWKYEQSVYVGHQIELPINILDANGDMLSLKLKTLGFDASEHRMELREQVNENGKIEAVFRWDITCEDLNIMKDNRYEVQFVASDNPMCATVATSTLSIAFNVKDIHSSFEHFEMPNVFTPNGDDKNEYFQMCDQPQCERQYVLPPDNCQGSFEGIEIFNRWGKSVFRNNSRDFKWSGEGMSDGIYYYVIRYTHKTIRGQLTLMR